MDKKHLEGMLKRLKPVLKDPVKARTILQRYWETRIALVWGVEDVHRAANERVVALTNTEAMAVLQKLLNQHNPQYGVKWEDLTTYIEDRVLGRKLTKPEIKRFVEQDILTVQK